MSVSRSQSFDTPGKGKIPELKNVEKSLKSSKEIDMSLLYTPSGAYVDIRHKYDTLYCEVHDRMQLMKKFTKYLKRVIDEKKKTSNDWASIVNEYMDDEPLLKSHRGNVATKGPLPLSPSNSKSNGSGGVPVVSSPIGGGDNQRGKKGGGVGPPPSRPPPRRSPSNHVKTSTQDAAFQFGQELSAQYQAQEAASNKMPPGLTPLNTQNLDSMGTVSGSKLTMMKGLESIMAYEYKLSLLEKTLWQRLEKEVYEPLYAFRTSTMKKLTSIMVNVHSKYNKLKEYGQKTTKTKKSAIEAWNALCNERSQLARLKNAKKINKSKDKVKKHVSIVKKDFIEVMTHVDKLNNQNDDFWNECLVNACEQLECIESCRIAYMNEYMRKYHEILLWRATESLNGLNRIHESNLMLFKPHEFVSITHYFLNGEYGPFSDSKWDAPYQYEIPCLPEEIGTLEGKHGEQRFNPKDLSSPRDPFGDQLNSLSKQMNAMNVHRRASTRGSVSLSLSQSATPKAGMSRDSGLIGGGLASPQLPLGSMSYPLFSQSMIAGRHTPTASGSTGFGGAHGQHPGTPSSHSRKKRASKSERGSGLSLKRMSSRSRTSKGGAAPPPPRKSGSRRNISPGPPPPGQAPRHSYSGSRSGNESDSKENSRDMESLSAAARAALQTGRHSAKRKKSPRRHHESLAMPPGVKRPKVPRKDVRKASVTARVQVRKQTLELRTRPLPKAPGNSRPQSPPALPPRPNGGSRYSYR